MTARISQSAQMAIMTHLIGANLTGHISCVVGKLFEAFDRIVIGNIENSNLQVDYAPKKIDNLVGHAPT